MCTVCIWMVPAGTGETVVFVSLPRRFFSHRCLLSTCLLLIPLLQRTLASTSVQSTRSHIAQIWPTSRSLCWRPTRTLTTGYWGVWLHSVTSNNLLAWHGIASHGMDTDTNFRVFICCMLLSLYILYLIYSNKMLHLSFIVIADFGNRIEKS